jgi:hypothetical protein
MSRAVIGLLCPLALLATLGTSPALAEESAETTTEEETDASLLEIGEAVPMTRREPTLPALSFEVDGHYGLVGSGPTTGTADIRFSIFDWWELRTGILPQPLGVMSRFRLGSSQSALGAFLIEGGLSGVELGFIAEDDENNADVRFYLDGGLGYQRAIGERFGVVANVRYRGRLTTEDDQEHLLGADARVLWDLPGHVSLSGGIAGAYALTNVREPSVAFVEIGQPGMSHFLVRIDQHHESVTLPISMTYGLSDSFDVDVFLTPRVYPQLDAHLGAGLRLRFIDPFELVDG